MTKKLPFDGENYMYNRGQIDATSNDMEVLKNISSQLKETARNYKGGKNDL